jgi:large subunit ribosomal protein L22
MTEKQYAPTKTEKKVSQKKVETPKTEIKTPVQKPEEKKPETTLETPKTEEKKTKTKKEVKKPVKKIVKEEVVVNAKSVKVSTKVAMAICRFIKHKPIEVAIKDLEEVVALRKPVPMKGEIPHRKGKIMSGRFPMRAAKEFIVLLKSLLGNANNHDVDEPIINFAMANQAQRPYSRGGIQRKRTHIVIKAKSKKKLNKKTKKKKK